MSFCIKHKTEPHSVWTTEMRFAKIGKMEPREHMLEARTHSQAQVIADRQNGFVIPLDADANPYTAANVRGGWDR